MRSSKADKPEPGNGPKDRNAPGRRRYEAPRLIDYGLVSKLTQTGGITTKDTGSMERVCL